MNTVTKTGKTTLRVLFSKIDLFNNYKTNPTFTRLIKTENPERKILTPKDFPEMENGGYKEYRGIIKGSTKREFRCKIFTWSSVIGLIEIDLNQYEKETTLYVMICLTHQRIKPRGHGMIFETPTHIIIAENYRGFTYDDSVKNKVLSSNESETVTIYSIEPVWQQMIWDHLAANRDLHLLRK